MGVGCRVPCMIGFNSLGRKQDGAAPACEDDICDV
jgi:hypothetical protein